MVRGSGARALGPDLLAGELAPLWIHLVAPVLGEVLAAVLYDRVLPGRATGVIRAGDALS